MWRRPGKYAPRRNGGDGEVEVFVVDEQHDHALDMSRWQKLATDVLIAERVTGQSELTVIFADEATMAELNTQFMGKQGPTDVLAFPIDAIEASRTPGPGALSFGPTKKPIDVHDHPLLLGDVVICPAVASRQASSHPGDFESEIALLLVHGILHVLGNDHDTPEAQAAMWALERKHLEASFWFGPAPHNFRHVPETTS
ncbi:MAG: rRNA maturation RNase YbeY [Ilumatobacteraceae bacterium]